MKKFRDFTLIIDRIYRTKSENYVWDSVLKTHFKEIKPTLGSFVSLH